MLLMIQQTRRQLMSNQNEFNTKAIELTHDELECVVGGQNLGQIEGATQAASQTALETANAMAAIKTAIDLNDAVVSMTKNIGESAKSAAQ
jgi:hypothetical protein